MNYLTDDKHGRFIRAYISFKGFVSYDELKQIAPDEGLEHQMKHINNPHEHDLDSIDNDIKKFVRTLVSRVLLRNSHALGHVDDQKRSIIPIPANTFR